MPCHGPSASLSPSSVPLSPLSSPSTPASCSTAATPTATSDHTPDPPTAPTPALTMALPPASTPEGGKTSTPSSPPLPPCAEGGGEGDDHDDKTCFAPPKAKGRTLGAKTPPPESCPVRGLPEHDFTCSRKGYFRCTGLSSVLAAAEGQRLHSSHWVSTMLPRCRLLQASTAACRHHFLGSQAGAPQAQGRPEAQNMECGCPDSLIQTVTSMCVYTSP